MAVIPLFRGVINVVNAEMRLAGDEAIRFMAVGIKISRYGITIDIHRKILYSCIMHLYSKEFSSLVQLLSFSSFPPAACIGMICAANFIFILTIMID